MERVTESAIHFGAPLDDQRWDYPPRPSRHGTVTWGTLILRCPVHVVAEATLLLAEVRVVRIPLLVTDRIVCRASTNLLVACVLIGYMAAKAQVIRVQALCQHGGVCAARLMDLLQERSAMTIHTGQILLGMHIRKHVGILQRSRVRRVTQSAIRIQAPLSDSSRGYPARPCGHGAMARGAVILRVPVHVVTEGAVPLSEVRIVGVQSQPRGALADLGIAPMFMAAKAELVGELPLAQRGLVVFRNKLDDFIHLLLDRRLVAHQTGNARFRVRVRQERF